MKLFLSTREKSYSPIYSWPPLDCMLLLPNYYGIQSWPKFKFNLHHPSFVLNIQDLMWTSHLTDSVTPGDLEVVYTKTEDAIEGVFWLATQTPPVLYCSPLKNSCWICAQKYGNGCKNNWIKITFLCNVISVTVSAHTYTTFHLSVGG